MAKPLSASRLRNVAKRLQAKGVTVKFYPGWDTRGRPYTFGPINGFMWHHTGSDAQSSSYLKFLFVDGRPGIPGPLCQFAVRDNGEVWFGAQGRANHAGKGSSRTLDRVMAESHDGYSKEIQPGVDDIDGNARYMGAEIMYSGGHAMTSAQYMAAVHLAAEIMREFGPSWSALSAIGHREHSARKWDPGKHSLAAMRRDTRDALQETGGTVSYNDVWRTDDKMKAPKSRRTDDNPYWWPENVMEHVANNIDDMPKSVWRWRGLDYVNEKASAKDHQIARAHEYSYEGVKLSRENNQLLKTLVAANDGLDAQSLLERIDQRSAEDAERDARTESLIQETNDRLDEAVQRDAQLLNMAQQIVDGGAKVDAKAVAREMLSLFHEATEPDTDEEAA